MKALLSKSQVPLWQWVGPAAAALFCIFGAITFPANFYPAYLQAFVYFLSLTLGCIGLCLLYGLTGGKWGKSLLPYLKAGSHTVFLMALLVAPLLIGVKTLYPWASPTNTPHHALIASKAAYLNVPFFIGRSGAYFLIWGLIAFLIRLRPKNEGLGQGLSGIFALLLFLTCSFAAIDWMMSLEPEWYSSIYGVLFIAGALVSTFSFLSCYSSKEGFEIDIRHDYGKLLFMSVMFWAYISFSQYLIMWSGQIPEEMSWYTTRMHHGWQWFGLLILIGIFVLPFLILLPSTFKKNAKILSTVACSLLFFRTLELFWLIKPASARSPKYIPLWEIACYVTVGSFWYLCFKLALRTSSARPPDKVNSQRKEETLVPQDR